MNERIKELRAALGLSQSEFSKRIDYSQCYAAELESGRKRVNDRIASLICERFGVSETWLRDGEGPMFAASRKCGDELDYVIKIYARLPESHRRYVVSMMRELERLVAVEEEAAR